LPFDIPLKSSSKNLHEGDDTDIVGTNIGEVTWKRTRKFDQKHAKLDVNGVNRSLISHYVHDNAGNRKNRLAYRNRKRERLEDTVAVLGRELIEIKSILTGNDSNQHAITINFNTRGLNNHTAGLAVENNLDMKSSPSILGVGRGRIVRAVQLHLELKKFGNDLAALKILLAITLINQIDRCGKYLPTDQNAENVRERARNVLKLKFGQKNQNTNVAPITYQTTHTSNLATTKAERTAATITATRTYNHTHTKKRDRRELIQASW